MDILFPPQLIRGPGRSVAGCISDVHQWTLNLLDQHSNVIDLARHLAHSAGVDPHQDTGHIHLTGILGYSRRRTAELYCSAYPNGVKWISKLDSPTASLRWSDWFPDEKLFGIHGEHDLSRPALLAYLVSSPTMSGPRACRPSDVRRRIVKSSGSFTFMTGNVDFQTDASRVPHS